MQYKVPQNVQREDQILWFITLRQLIILMVGCGLSYWLYVHFSKEYELGTLGTILVWIPGAISAAFAFLKIKHIPLGQFIMLLIEQLFFRPRLRFWCAHGGEAFVSMTTRFVVKKEEQEAQIEEKDLSSEKIKHLAKLLDGEKSNVQKKKGF